jgi:high-affinity iron transporter
MTAAAIGEAAIILLREGLEALLILAAIAAYLTRLGETARLRIFWAGAGAAVTASFAMAWVFQRFYGGAHDDLIEGVVMLAAALLLFYVSGWLFLRQDPKAWQGYVKEHAERAAGATSALPLAGIAFLAVFREGAETVLFLYALSGTYNGAVPEIFIGIVLGAVALAIIFTVWRRFSVRLPLRPLFLVTSAFLFLMALRFIGDAFQEFQEQALMPFDDTGLPNWILDPLVDYLGLNPSAEALGFQLAVILVAICTALWARRRYASASAG